VSTAESEATSALDSQEANFLLAAPAPRSVLLQALVSLCWLDLHGSSDWLRRSFGDGDDGFGYRGGCGDVGATCGWFGTGCWWDYRCASGTETLRTHVVCLGVSIKSAAGGALSRFFGYLFSQRDHESSLFTHVVVLECMGGV